MNPIPKPELSEDLMPLEREQAKAIIAAEAILHTVLGYIPDQPGDASVIRARIRMWLARDAVKTRIRE